MDEAVSTLGLKWLPGLDCFSFQFRPILTSSPATRRTMLADIARTFNPMGWLSPVLSDSSVVLEWIRGHPSRWPTFVANRVSDIQTGPPDASWRLVRTMDNLADCATRGLSPLDLAVFSLWWTGPPWILDEETTWPASIVPPDQSVQVMIARQAPPPAAAGCLPDFGPFSSFNRMVKVLCSCRQWLTALRRGEATISRAEDWRQAECLCFRLIQAHHSADDVTAITSGRILHKRSNLAKLHPFVDSEGLIRVGERLQHAPLSYPLMAVHSLCAHTSVASFGLFEALALFTQVTRTAFAALVFEPLQWSNRWAHCLPFELLSGDLFRQLDWIMPGRCLYYFQKPVKPRPRKDTSPFSYAWWFEQSMWRWCRTGLPMRSSQRFPTSVLEEDCLRC
ncbi:unnamed protein product [Trichogramma brassicae]|uniref:Uncharacterized protein n=1 Tax=Trichogramma brassicae TaxID=86971 RepID=A0A6H5ISC4_9HYME|nr:unnamed protein product [Trichogramma brassicae]